ncbi:MAG: aldose epimerase family protein [Candidatus Limimorpha sp.]
MKKKTLILATALLMVGCGKQKVELISADNFNTQVDGKQVSLYTMHNGDITLQTTNFGGRIVALWMPDRRGSYSDIVLGYENIDKYLNESGERALGAAIGRCANRIGNATFTLDSLVYHLTKNDGENTQNGGEKGADRMVWDVVSSNDSTIVMHVQLPDGQDGFPGNLDVTMTYALTYDNQLVVRYKATTDKPTLCNFANHLFFNLRGKGDILKHNLQINARYITPINAQKVANGRYLGVKGKALDFTEAHRIGDSIKSKDLQIQYGNGYDHNYVIDKTTIDEYALAATLNEPKSRREMQIWTNQIGVQFNSGNTFDGTVKGKQGKALKAHGGLALDTQFWPDAINYDTYPSPILRPGEEYDRITIYKFAVTPKK